MTSPPPRAPSVPPAERATVEARIAVLRAEVEVDADRTRRATLLHEVGHLYEVYLRDEQAAVREYLAAFNLDPTFRSPLHALVRVFEARRSHKNLLRLYEAEARAAEGPEGVARALLDQAAFAEDFEQDRDRAANLLAQAERTGAASPVVLLSAERLSRRMERGEDAERMVAARAPLTDDERLRAELWLEAAEADARHGRLREAIDKAGQALASPIRLRALMCVERYARQAGDVPRMADALVEQARIAAAAARGEATEVDHPWAQVDVAAAVATDLFCAAAALRGDVLADGAAARTLLEEALRTAPSSVAVRLALLGMCERLGDFGAARKLADELLVHDGLGPSAAGLWFRVAEHELAEARREDALEALGRAVAADPTSTAAKTMRVDLLGELGRQVDRADALAVAARAESGEAAGQLWCEAALAASEDLSDLVRARSYWNEAEAAGMDAVTVRREWFGAALRAGDAAQAETAAAGLSAALPGGPERTALYFERFALLHEDLQQPDAARGVLGAALDDGAARSTMAMLARVVAAAAGDDALLARAHTAARDEATPGDTDWSVHTCAAARAEARAGNTDAASSLLKQVLEREPSHPYALALMEEVLRATGHADAVVELLRHAAESHVAADHAITALLLAGAAAEAVGDFEAARKSYVEASDRDATDRAPLLSLARLAVRSNDDALALEVLEALSARSTSEGAATRFTLELGERHALGGRVELADDPLCAALDTDDLATHAALVALVAGPATSQASLHAKAIARLAMVAPERLRMRIAKVAGDQAVVTEGSEGALASAVAQALAADESDFWANIHRMRGLGAVRVDGERGAPPGNASGNQAHDAARARALGAMALATTATEQAAELGLAQLRALVVAAADDVENDALLIAQQIENLAPGSATAAVALDETLGSADDADTRAHALSARLAHTSEATAPAVRAALGRTLLSGRRADEAAVVLAEAVDADPDDLASLEALRLAARGRGDFATAIDACDRLVPHVQGPLRAALLEEAAQLLMDELERPDDAEARLRDALAVDARRPIAYGRLHDLLSDRGDSRGLLELTAVRLAADRDPIERERLLYERARLHRSLGERVEALVSLADLYVLAPLHVGGLALEVEIQSSLSRHVEAVDALRRLARADVPDAQRRVALLGAADFLEHRLDDPGAALGELVHADELGFADSETYARMGRLAHAVDRIADAAAYLERAAAHAEGLARADFEMQASAIHQFERADLQAAAACCMRALDAVPTHDPAAAALLELLDDDAKGLRDVADGFERAVRAVLAPDPANPETLRKLLTVAALRADADLEFRIFDALAALGHATDDEAEALREARAEMPRFTPRPLDDATRNSLWPTDPHPTARQLSRCLAPWFRDLDNLSTASFRVGKPEQVGRKERHPLKDELAALAGVVGVAVAEVYSGGPDPSGLVAFPGKEGSVWIAGVRAAPPLEERWRFRVGQLAFAVAEGGLFVAMRSHAEAVALLDAVAAAVEAPLAGAPAGPELARVASQVARLLSRGARREARDLLVQVPGGRGGLSAHVRALQAGGDRLGLLFAGSIGVAFQAVHEAAGDGARGAIGERARDLLTYWLSPEAGVIRHRMGMSL